ncbi:dephospho-CoA kinase [Pleurocapsales cyanobacterium LEGE 06147]|nr:dephospho-CoA kinase [Pleurocapsales cyanobacterium LEGE 06147]
MVNIPKRRIGLTGGIGTGKTTVSNYLVRAYHLPVLDADIYARDAVKAGSPILTDIFNRYGNKVKLPDNNLNRSALGEIIFNNPEEKLWLESKIHPYVRDRFTATLQQLEVDTVVLAIPLLFEAKMTDLVTEIWVVSCDRQEQVRRLIERDRLSEAQAQARIKSQLPLEQKVAMADVVLNNNSTVEELLRQVDIAIDKSTTDD